MSAEPKFARRSHWMQNFNYVCNQTENHYIWHLSHFILYLEKIWKKRVDHLLRWIQVFSSLWMYIMFLMWYTVALSSLVLKRKLSILFRFELTPSLLFLVVLNVACVFDSCIEFTCASVSQMIIAILKKNLQRICVHIHSSSWNWSKLNSKISFVWLQEDVKWSDDFSSLSYKENFVKWRKLEQLLSFENPFKEKLNLLTL